MPLAAAAALALARIQPGLRSRRIWICFRCRPGHHDLVNASLIFGIFANQCLSIGPFTAATALVTPLPRKRDFRHRAVPELHGNQ